jgi:predicted TIM-barrel fold metal-dependent hydrolase
MRFLSDDDVARLQAADAATQALPLPTQMISNGEYHPLPQTEAQRGVEARIVQYAATLAPRHGMSRRQFLGSSAGMAAAFLAMNEVFGPLFSASRAEAATPGVADARSRGLASQFIIDCQTHFVRDDYEQQLLIDAATFAKQHWNPALEGEDSLTRFKFENFLKEIFLDSDTKIALISGTPTDADELLFLSNDQIAAARDVINKISGSRRALGHGIVTPGSPGYLDEVDRILETLNPQSLKGYTIGDPLYQTNMKTAWRLDDEKNVYPMYEKMLRAGLDTICIHKGLMPADYMTSMPDLWQYATVWDVGKAAKDWPQINFVIYHSAMRPFIELPDRELAQFEATGRFDWVSDLADIPAKYGVTNVYGELGTCFANTCVTHPKLAAALLGTLVKGLGADRIIWGTDCVWWGSPQWQIEAMRRIEIPRDMQEKYGCAPLGPADGPIKSAIFAGNAARLYGVEPEDAGASLGADEIEAVRRDYLARGGLRSNLRYGYIAA